VNANKKQVIIAGSDQPHDGDTDITCGMRDSWITSAKLLKSAMIDSGGITRVFTKSAKKRT